MENASEWEPGGFRFNIPSSRLAYGDRHPVTKEQMSPVPEVLQGAEWNAYRDGWNYNEGALTVYVEYCAPPQEEEMTICGRQTGNRLEPFSYPMPRFLAISAGVMSFTEYPFPQEKEFALGTDIPDEEVQGGDEFVVVTCMFLCILLLPVLLPLLNIWNARWLCR